VKRDERVGNGDHVVRAGRRHEAMPHRQAGAPLLVVDVRTRHIADSRSRLYAPPVSSDLNDFLQRYADDVYHARDARAATRYIADPCVRHEHGHLVTMSLADNIARIASFLETAEEVSFSTALNVGNGEHIASAYEVIIGDRTMSGIEIFRVVDGKIVETWNSTVQPGLWG
jgi:predicted SnoaL-like aldol condensation-catalyzing enzyme